MNKTGVLLVNIGTPDRPTAVDVRRFLHEFLSDPRIIGSPSVLWKCILYGLILPFRPGKIAIQYQSIWMDQGSPLLVYARRQGEALEEKLKANAMSIPVEIAMRYGAPSIKDAFARLTEAGVRRVLVVGLYPQYSGATSASLGDELERVSKEMPLVSDIRTVLEFYDHPSYIKALSDALEHVWEKQGRGEKLLVSYHGLPEQNVERGDPYRKQCERTTELLVRSLKLSPEQYSLSYQSRFAKGEWLKPYTDKLLESWAKEGVSSVDVICPGFTVDCLETLFEIAISNKERFIEAGGKTLRYIPLLNDNPLFIEAIADIVKENLYQ